VRGSATWHLYAKYQNHFQKKNNQWIFLDFPARKIPVPARVGDKGTIDRGTIFQIVSPDEMIVTHHDPRDSCFIHIKGIDTKNWVDGQQWSGYVTLSTTYSYTNTLGSTSTIPSALLKPTDYITINNFISGCGRPG